MFLARELGSVLTRGENLALLDAGVVAWQVVETIETDRLEELLGETKTRLVKEFVAERAAAAV